MKTPQEWKMKHFGQLGACDFDTIKAIQSDARQDLAEQVTKLEAQLKEANDLLRLERNGIMSIERKWWSEKRDAFLASLDQREGKGRKI